MHEPSLSRKRRGTYACLRHCLRRPADNWPAYYFAYYSD